MGIELDGIVARMRDMRNACKSLVGKPNKKGDVDGSMIFAFV